MDLIKHFWYIIHAVRRYETVAVFKCKLHWWQCWKRLEGLFQFFSDNLAVALHIFASQHKHNIHTLTLGITLVCSCSETVQRSSFFYLFLKHVQINYIMYVYCISPTGVWFIYHNILTLYICVLMVSTLPLSTILLLDFGIVPTVWYFSHLIIKNLLNINLKIEFSKRRVWGYLRSNQNT